MSGKLNVAGFSAVIEDEMVLVDGGGIGNDTSMFTPDPSGGFGGGGSGKIPDDGDKCGCICH